MRFRTLGCACVACLLAACSGKRLVLGGDGDAGCMPGIYSGTYDCNTSPDSSLQLTGTGSVSLTLTGDRGAPTLSIAPGAGVSGSQQGVTSAAELSGTLDCVTNRLTGKLSHITYKSAGFTANFSGTGDMSADYDASASPPALVDGIIGPPQMQGAPGAPQPQGTCTWTATLQ